MTDFITVVGRLGFIAAMEAITRPPPPPPRPETPALKLVASR